MCFKIKLGLFFQLGVDTDSTCARIETLKTTRVLSYSAHT
jgi:hypothetical protein